MLTRFSRGVLLITLSCCALAWLSSSLACLSYPAVPEIVVTAAHPNFSRIDGPVGAQDSIQVHPPSILPQKKKLNPYTSLDYGRETHILLRCFVSI